MGMISRTSGAVSLDCERRWGNSPPMKITAEFSIGYIRIILLLISSWAFNDPVLFIPCYVISIILDGFDGFAARRLNQISEFGAWFDVAIDNFGRSMLWNLLYDWGHFISSLEWLVFVCTHGSMGGDWKNKFENSPWWVRKTMSNGFKNSLGAFAISGLHVLPVWLYGYHKLVLTNNFPLPLTLQWFTTAFLISGRFLCMAVELWCIWIHILFLAQKETKGK
ncbi:uncharacterized protein si:ch1073-145m9.1 isoform X1 [Pristis pectinata]|uniref:uncharacterized protein si:ch1073-145m9.1 isoform X1 n=1 Tax=Pristis pectinata TaxID=685728 RepID=UPI00223E6029|nr:uncharacterized protein si:ch1073-145m9.1 isoform X1 [Pristis pectinata]